MGLSGVSMSLMSPADLLFVGDLLAFYGNATFGMTELLLVFLGGVDKDLMRTWLVGSCSSGYLDQTYVCFFFWRKFFRSLLARDLLARRRTRRKTGRPLGGKEGGVPKSK
jgi:hypothetical protein